MKFLKDSLLLCACIFLFISCGRSGPEGIHAWKPGEPIDTKLTDETKALYYNLKSLTGKGILFGQQDALLYGVDRNPDEGCCDIKDVTGSYPSVYGFDIGHILDSMNVDGVPFKKMIRLIKEGYARGGLITISWHEKNPLTGGGAWDTTAVVNKLLPGGELHETLRERLSLIADFFNQLKDSQGKPIPVVFRPYHEHNGDWFWWGKGHCKEQEYIALWQFTVSILRDTLGLHQLLYAISPDRSRMGSVESEAGFLYGYPGDEYVDLLGLDNYWDVGRSSDYIKDITRSEQDSLMLGSLRTLARLAEKRNKIAAFTETGLDGLKEVEWYTDRLLKPLRNDTLARKIAYILVWRNANREHFYAPFPGQASCEDFIKFKNDSLIMFEDEMPKLYK